MLQRAIRSTADWIDLQWSLLAKALRRVAPSARGRLLDVGCGDKQFESIFRPYVSEYIGIEHTATFSATSASLHSRPDYLYDGSRLPFEDGSFATVVSIQVLEHTPNPQLLIREMVRVLRKDGTLIVAAPFSFRLHEEPHDYFRYTPHGLRELCLESAVIIERVEQVGSLWSLIGHKVNTYLALRIARMGSAAQQLGKLGHEVESRSRPRYWMIPIVAPAIVAIAAISRLMDSVFFESQEALGFIIIARHH